MCRSPAEWVCVWLPFVSSCWKYVQIGPFTPSVLTRCTGRFITTIPLCVPWWTLRPPSLLSCSTWDLYLFFEQTTARTWCPLFLISLTISLTWSCLLHRLRRVTTPLTIISCSSLDRAIIHIRFISYRLKIGRKAFNTLMLKHHKQSLLLYVCDIDWLLLMISNHDNE